MAEMNTVYPGSRIETGGGALRKYVTYIDNIFLPYKEIASLFKVSLQTVKIYLKRYNIKKDINLRGLSISNSKRNKN